MSALSCKCLSANVDVNKHTLHLCEGWKTNCKNVCLGLFYSKHSVMHFVLFRATLRCQRLTRICPPGVRQHLDTRHDSCALMSLTADCTRTGTRTRVHALTHTHRRSLGHSFSHRNKYLFIKVHLYTILLAFCRTSWAF